MDRLYRSLDDRILAGVAGGMAEAWDLDPAIVRLAWVIMTPITAGFALVVYVILAIVVPEGSSGMFASPTTDAAAGTTPPAPPGPGTGPSATPSGPGAAPGMSSPTAGAGWQPGAPTWREERRAEQARRRAERAAWRAQRRAARGGRPDDSAIIAGVALIVLGAVFLASQLLPAFNWAFAWPVALIALGALLIIRSARDRP